MRRVLSSTCVRIRTSSPSARAEAGQTEFRRRARMQGIRGVQGILGIPPPINEPMFSLGERDRRWARLRELMDQDGIDLLIVLPESITSDSLYIADTAGVTVFPRDGDPVLILGGESSNYA